MIRKAEINDIPLIIDLLTQVVNIHADLREDLFTHDKTKYNENDLLNILDNERTPIFVYDEDGVKGYIFLVIEDEDNSNLNYHKTLYIDDLCVDDAYRNQNIGKKLMEYAEEYAKGIDCEYITLNVWDGNDSAYQFYEKMGYQTRKIYMEKKI